jgi:hypothetical protein
MKTRHMLLVNTFLFAIVIMISFVSKSLGTPLVASASTNENPNLLANYSENKYYLPIIQIPYPIFISPGTYVINRCVDSSVYAASDGTYIAELTECVPSVEVRADGYMQFNYTWTLDFANDSYHITKYDDADNQNMYITDNLNNHYDHIEVGGAAAHTVTMYDNEPVEGWFLFIPAKQSATTFVFHDDDQGVSIKNIILVP